MATLYQSEGLAQLYGFHNSFRPEVVGELFGFKAEHPNGNRTNLIEASSNEGFFGGKYLY